MHWPVPTLYDGDYISTWKAMTELVKDGRLRTAGVSNFQPEHLDRIVAATGVVPAVNQIEVHPYFTNDIVRAASSRHGVSVEAHSPLGHGQGRLLNDPVIRQVAAARDKTSAQIVLRWHLQHGRIVFPKSVHRERMDENLNVQRDPPLEFTPAPTDDDQPITVERRWPGVGVTRAGARTMG